MAKEGGEVAVKIPEVRMMAVMRRISREILLGRGKLYIATSW